MLETFEVNFDIPELLNITISSLSLLMMTFRCIRPNLTNVLYEIPVIIARKCYATYVFQHGDVDITLKTNETVVSHFEEDAI